MAARLEGKRCIVTGGSKGIGRAIVERFLAEGASVLATARSAPGDSLPASDHLAFLPGDTADPAHARALVALAVERFGGLDVVVNNAGMQIEKTIADTTDEEWDRIFDVNVKGVVADPGLAAYCATKGAVHALSKAIAVDHGAQGVRCNVICPGWIKTEMMDAFLNSLPDPKSAAGKLDANQPIGRVGQPGDIASMALWLASDESAFTTGQLFVCDGGLTARAPQP